MSKFYFIINGKANRGSSKNSIDSLCKFLDTQENVIFVFTEYVSHATELCKQAVLNGFTHIIACGGDGTVHEVINGIMSFEKSHRPKFGVIPLGSGNDFAFALGLLTKDLQTRIEGVFQENYLTIDVAKISAFDTKNQFIKTEYWNNSVGIGFDANVTIQSRKIKLLRGVLIYLVAVIQTIAKHFNFFKAKIIVDNSMQNYTEDFFMMTLGNGFREGGGFITTPMSIMNDGKLEYMIVPKLTRRAVLGLIPKVMQGTHVNTNYANFGTFNIIEIISETPMPIHIDGEIFATKFDSIYHIIAEIESDALEVINAKIIDLKNSKD